MFDDDYPGDIVLGVGANTQHCRPNQLSGELLGSCSRYVGYLQGYGSDFFHLK